MSETWLHKIIEWAWTIIVAAAAYVWRLEAGMHRQNAKIEILEREMRQRVENAQSLQSSIAAVTELIERHRVESAGRMDALRSELREDIRLIMHALNQSGGR